jgi:hypothetical protein
MISELFQRAGKCNVITQTAYGCVPNLKAMGGWTKSDALILVKAH